MRLNHLNIGVPDLDEASTFLTTHFGLKEVHRQKDFIAILLDETGFVLAVSREAEPKYPKLFHLGFLQDTREQVDALFERFQALGLVRGEGPRPVHGSYGFYFHALGGVMFEVSAFLG